MTNSEHTYKQFDVELESLRSRVLRMGGLIEQQIIKAIEGLTTCDLTTIEQVIVNDHLVNGMEVEIDEQCNHIIALRQPAAGDETGREMARPGNGLGGSGCLRIDSVL